MWFRQAFYVGQIASDGAVMTYCGMNTDLYLQWPLFVNTLVGAAMTNYKKKN